MKKLFIIISIIFTFFISFNYVSADTYSPVYYDTINNKSFGMYTGWQSFYNSNGHDTLVYKSDGSEHDYSFEFISSSYYGGIRIGGTNNYETVLNTGLNVFYSSEWTSINNGDVVNFTTSYTYILIVTDYGTLTTDNISFSGTSSEPTIPHVTILDHDFYLFYDFDTISDFDIFNNYDFTNFTDFEKIVVTIIVNILYDLVLFTSIYILLKALNKLLSWVFH